MTLRHFLHVFDPCQFEILLGYLAAVLWAWGSHS